MGEGEVVPPVPHKFCRIPAPVSSIQVPVFQYRSFQSIQVPEGKKVPREERRPESQEESQQERRGSMDVGIHLWFCKYIVASSVFL